MNLPDVPFQIVHGGEFLVTNFAVKDGLCTGMCLHVMSVQSDVSGESLVAKAATERLPIFRCQTVCLVVVSYQLVVRCKHQVTEKALFWLVF